MLGLRYVNDIPNMITAWVILNLTLQSANQIYLSLLFEIGAVTR